MFDAGWLQLVKRWTRRRRGEEERELFVYPVFLCRWETADSLVRRVASACWYLTSAGLVNSPSLPTHVPIVDLRSREYSVKRTGVLIACNIGKKDSFTVSCLLDKGGNVARLFLFMLIWFPEFRVCTHVFGSSYDLDCVKVSGQVVWTFPLCVSSHLGLISADAIRVCAVVPCNVTWIEAPLFSVQVALFFSGFKVTWHALGVLFLDWKERK